MDPGSNPGRLVERSEKSQSDHERGKSEYAWQARKAFSIIRFIRLAAAITMMKVSFPLLFKGIILVAYFLTLFLNPNLLIEIFNYSVSSVKLYQILWFCIIVILIKDMIPSTSRSYGLRNAFLIDKLEKKTPATKERLKEFDRRTGQKAVAIGIFWLCLLAIIGLLYFLNIIGPVFLFSLIIVGFFLDELFITIWCPFKEYQKNKCCKTCRICNWGPLMVFCFLIYLPNFYTYSLILISLLMFIHWEYLHHSRPEGFSELSNPSLRCVNCDNKCGKLAKKNV
jgi:hypothetical protein